MNIKLEDIINWTNGNLIQRTDSYIIKKVITDSRESEPNSLYIPRKGEKFDGHLFIKSAYEKGARFFLKAKDVDVEIVKFPKASFIEVDDVEDAFIKITKEYRNTFGFDFIAITGSVGKTSTKDMVYGVLSQKYLAHKNPGNWNNHVGLPLTILSMEKNTQRAVLEMGMSNLGEIDFLAEIVKPKIAVISNIGMSHIELLKSRENILKAKMEITNYFDKNSTLIINGDDEYLKTIKKQNLNYSLITYGFESENDMVCTKYSYNDKDLLEFEVKYKNKLYVWFTSAKGKHNVYNAMAAIIIGFMQGLNEQEIQKGLLSFEKSKMRLDIIKGSFIIINDVYNASPDSMKSSLDVLNEFKGYRKIAILGEMLEMGKFSKMAHEIVGKHGYNIFDVLITIGKDAKYIAEEAIKNGMDKKNIYMFETNQQVINHLKEKFEINNDAILVKGSRGMKMEEIVDSLKERI